jgi:hypothetical protein
MTDEHLQDCLKLALTHYFFYWWGRTKSLGTAATSGLLYKPQMIDDDDFWSSWWNEDWQGKPKYSEKTCPSATLSTIKSHMTRPRLERWTAAVGSQRLTAWAMVQPNPHPILTWLPTAGGWNADPDVSLTNTVSLYFRSMLVLQQTPCVVLFLPIYLL